MGNIYWLWYEIAFALEIISIIVGLTYLSSTRAKNLEKVWLFYSMYRWKFVEWKKSWTFSKIIWIILTLLINPFFSWIDILFRGYSYINILVQKLSTPEKLKEIQYKLWATILTKEEVKKLIQESANFLWKSLDFNDEEWAEDEENNTLILQDDENWYSDIEIYKNKIYSNSHPADYLSDFNRIYEYKIEWSDVYQRLLEARVEHAGDKEYYNVKDWIVLESEIIEREKSLLKYAKFFDDEKLKELKKECKWHKITFWEIKCFILSKHPEIVSKEDFKKYVRSELERIKMCLLKVKELFAEYKVTLEYDTENKIYSWKFNKEDDKFIKLDQALVQLWKQIKCERYEIEKSEETISILNWYLN